MTTTTLPAAYVRRLMEAGPPPGAYVRLLERAHRDQRAPYHYTVEIRAGAPLTTLCGKPIEKPKEWVKVSKPPNGKVCAKCLSHFEEWGIEEPTCAAEREA